MEYRKTEWDMFEALLISSCKQYQTIVSELNTSNIAEKGTTQTCYGMIKIFYFSYQVSLTLVCYDLFAAFVYQRNKTDHLILVYLYSAITDDVMEHN